MSLKPLIYSALIYSIPKTLSYMTTEPPNLETRINKIRNEAYEWTEIFIQNLGNNNWNLLMDISVDNAWIASIGISALLHNNTDLSGIKKIIFIGLNYLGIGSCIWLIRLAAHKSLQAINSNYADVFKTRK